MMNINAFKNGFALCFFFAFALQAVAQNPPSEPVEQTVPTGFTVHAESHDLRAFTAEKSGEHVILLDENGTPMFRCLDGNGFKQENVKIDPERGLILRGTVSGAGESGKQVPPQHQHSAGVMSGKHYHDAFSFWSFSPQEPTNRVRLDIFCTIPRPLGSKLAVWSFADDWYTGGGSVISMELDFIEAGGRAAEWVDGKGAGLFRYHPNIHSWFGGGSPWSHQSIQHMEPKNLDFGPESSMHKLSVEWINGPQKTEKILRYLLNDQMVYERSVAELKTRRPILQEGGNAGLKSSLNAQEIAEFMWNKPQNLQIWYGADESFFLADPPIYGDDWPSEMIVQRIDVFR